MCDCGLVFARHKNGELHKEVPRTNIMKTIRISRLNDGCCGVLVLVVLQVFVVLVPHILPALE